MSSNRATPVQPGAGQANPAVTSGSYQPAPTPTTHRPDRPEWTAAKSAGDVGEELIAAVFRALGLLVEQEHGHAPFDLAVSGRIEVKTDRRAQQTGNVAVEISYRGRAAGISTSSATGWAFVVGCELMLMPAPTLRELVKRGRYRLAKAGEHAVVALVPLADLRRIARTIRFGEGVRP